MTAPVRVHRVLAGPDDAPVLVLANSLGSTLEMWDPQVHELARRFRVVRYDLRGHGGTPAPPGPYGIADLGADLVALLDDLGVGRAHLAGLSLGGMVALWVAAHAPGRVDRLALLCTSARLGPPGAWAARARTVLAEGAGAVAEAVVGRWFTPEYAADHPDVVARSRAMVASSDAEGYAGCCWAIERMDLVPDLPRVVAPTLVIAGGRDPAIPPPHGEVIARGVRHGRLVLIADGAHLVNVQYPDEVTGLVVEHLAATPEEAPA